MEDPTNMKKISILKILIYAFLLTMSLACLFPFFWMIRSSFMSSEEIFAIPMKWIPNEILYINYSEALSSIPFYRYFLNTIFIVVVAVIANVLSSSFAAFGFTRIQFPGRNFFFALVLSTLMIPSTVMLIPQFNMWKAFGAYDTYIPLLLPAFFINAFFIFMFKQFFAGIPIDYDEAAFIDGANYFTIYSRLILPMSKPAMATVGVFTFMGAWNDFFGPLIYLQDMNKYTLALGLTLFKSQFITQWHYMMAISTVITIPMILLYFFAQRYFVQGITFSGIKG